LMFVILASLWVTLLGLIAPSFTRIFVDYVLIAGLTDWIMPLCVFMLATAVSVASLVALQQHFLLRLETKLSIAASSQFLWHVLKLPMDFLTSAAPPTLVCVYRSTTESPNCCLVKLQPA
ncbi:MAG: hypothetical protein HC853_10005, partial [Anaerolineae bacterium]|nr:hypothetical protein [Anaerolineae bacterium]